MSPLSDLGSRRAFLPSKPSSSGRPARRQPALQLPGLVGGQRAIAHAVVDALLLTSAPQRRTGLGVDGRVDGRVVVVFMVAALRFGGGEGRRELFPAMQPSRRVLAPARQELRGFSGRRSPPAPAPATPRPRRPPSPPSRAAETGRHVNRRQGGGGSWMTVENDLRQRRGRGPGGASGAVSRRLSTGAGAGTTLGGLARRHWAARRATHRQARASRRLRLAWLVGLRPTTVGGSGRPKRLSVFSPRRRACDRKPRPR